MLHTHRNPPPKEQEVYAVPPSDGSIVYTAEQRTHLLDKWRYSRRYKLTPDERTSLASLKTWQANISTLTYAGIAGTWWLTGPQNDAAFYERFGMKVTEDGFLKDWLKVQKVKLQWNIVARLGSSFAVTIPFAYWLASTQDQYFERTLQSPTAFGGFARYLKQQGDRTTNGELVEKYRSGHLYNEVSGQSKKMRVSGDELLADRVVDINFAKPEKRAAPRAESRQAGEYSNEVPAPLRPGSVADDAAHWTIPPVAGVAVPVPALPSATRLSSQDPTDQFCELVFGR
ncbi:hypothetical protein DIPPA_35176 [Diplonema papillatum]|nr:hypothetical protein DIPPA_35176 [Diplonema papillatum]